MAINPELSYPGKITPASAAYPYGQARNITLPGDGTGTPWEAALVNDIFGFQQWLLSEAGEVPTGSPDTALSSQYGGALYTLIRGALPYFNIVNYGADPTGASDDTTAINDTIIAAAAAGGGTVLAPPGTYNTSGIVLLDGVNLVGFGTTSVIINQTGAVGVGWAAAGWVEGIKVGFFTLDYQHTTPDQTHIGLKVGSCWRCDFSDIRLQNYSTPTALGAGVNDGQIAIKLAPDSVTALKRNTIFNIFYGIFINDARVGVEYEGVTGSGSFGGVTVQDPLNTAVAANVISSNTWLKVTMWNITERGIKAIQWADSEKWYDPYIRLAEDNTKCIDLGTDPTYFTQIDRFRIVNPNLEFLGSAIVATSTCTALRMGPGGLRHSVNGIVSDEDWDSGAGNNFFDVSNAQSYEITGGHSGQGVNYANYRMVKGSSTQKLGTATILNGTTSIVVPYDSLGTNKLTRTPIVGEIMVTPMDNMLAATKFWIQAIGASSFQINVDVNPGGDIEFAWRIELGEV